MWNDIFVSIFSRVGSVAQSDLPKNFLDPTSVDPVTILQVLGSLTFLIILIIIGTLRYQRWKKYNDFISEMKTLDLDPDEEGTLASMVRRFQMDEPVNILFSARLFDEMASTEIVRVLGSPASAKSKQEFIDQVYNIRTRTYHPDWQPLNGSYSDMETSSSLYPNDF